MAQDEVPVGLSASFPPHVSVFSTKGGCLGAFWAGVLTIGWAKVTLDIGTGSGFTWEFGGLGTWDIIDGENMLVCRGYGTSADYE